MAGTDRGGSGRDETAEQRQDRLWADQLQELRVMQTGAQLTAGFLLTLPFQEEFADLDDVQRAVYLGLVVLAGVTTALLLAPVAIHRRLTGRHVKERIVVATHRLMAGVLGCLGLLVVGITLLIFDVVVDRAAALVAAGAVAMVVLALLVALPGLLARSGAAPDPAPDPGQDQDRAGDGAG